MNAILLGFTPDDLFAILTGLGLVPHVIDAYANLSRIAIVRYGDVIWWRQ
jgi:hypothetical protein